MCRRSLTCPPASRHVSITHLQPKARKDERAKQIEADTYPSSKRTSATRSVFLPTSAEAFEGFWRKTVLATCHDERTNKRLLTKDSVLDRDNHRAHLDQESQAHRYNDKGPAGERQIDEIEEMTSAPDRICARSQ